MANNFVLKPNVRSKSVNISDTAMFESNDIAMFERNLLSFSFKEI